MSEIVIHQIQKLKKSLERTHRFVDLLYNRVYEVESDECKQILKEVREILDKEYIEALHCEQANNSI